MLNPQRVALSLTATTAILYAICSIAYALIPGPTAALSQAAFHNMLAAGAITFGSFLLGLVTLCVAAYIAGTIYAWLYNAFATSSDRGAPASSARAHG